MKRMLIGAFSILLLASQTAMAAETNLPSPVEAPSVTDDQAPIIKALKAGDRASFDGVLLSPEAVAQIISDKEAAENAAMIERAKAVDECKLEAQKNLNLFKIVRDADLASVKAEKDALVQNNLQLTKALKEEIANRPNPILWTGIGAVVVGAVAAGVLLLTK